MVNKKVISAAVLAILVLMYGTAWWVSREPAMLIAEIKQEQRKLGDDAITGYSTTTALIRVSETLLYKSGGYLANDIMPPFSLLDNMPSWELGVLEMSQIGRAHV